MTKSNTHLDTLVLAAIVDDLASKLEEASADAILFARLRDAQGNADALTVDLAKARDSLAAGHAAEAKAKAAKRYAQFKGIAITATQSALTSAHPNALSATYDITYKRLAYDHSLRDSVWQERHVQGFQGLEPDVWDYLMNAAPHALPPIIMNLAPGDPMEAMRIYFMGLQRGYLSA